MECAGDDGDGGGMMRGGGGHGIGSFNISPLADDDGSD